MGKLLLKCGSGGVGRFGDGHCGDGKNSGGETKRNGEKATWHVRAWVDYTGPGNRTQGRAQVSLTTDKFWGGLVEWLRRFGGCSGDFDEIVALAVV